MIWGVYTLLMSVRERTSIELPSALSGSNALMAWPGVASMRTVWANAAVASAVKRNAIWADLRAAVMTSNSPPHEPVCPLEEVLQVRGIGVAPIVLPPGQLAVQEPDVHGRHRLRAVVVGDAQILRAEQLEDGARRHGGHVAPAVVQPARVALLRHAVADEGEAGRAQRDQLVRVDGKVGGRLGPAVLQVVARHPVVFARAGQGLDGLAEAPPMERGAPFAGGADESHEEAGLEREGHERGFAIAGDAFDPHVSRVHGRVGLEIVQSPRGAPGPGPQRAPIVRLAKPSLVDETDDAACEPGAVVGLDATRVDHGIAPPVLEQLLRGLEQERPECGVALVEIFGGWLAERRERAAAEPNQQRHRSLRVGR